MGRSLFGFIFVFKLLQIQQILPLCAVWRLHFFLNRIFGFAKIGQRQSGQTWTIEAHGLISVSGNSIIQRCIFDLFAIVALIQLRCEHAILKIDQSGSVAAGNGLFRVHVLWFVVFHVLVYAAVLRCVFALHAGAHLLVSLELASEVQLQLLPLIVDLAVIFQVVIRRSFVLFDWYGILIVWLVHQAALMARINPSHE